MNQQEIMLAAIGDLEVTRRQLIMEIQARDEYIQELEGKLGIVRNEDGSLHEASANGLVLPDTEIVLP
jgi:hypothetical protein